MFPDRVSDNPNDPGSYIDPVDSIKYILVLPFGTDTKNLKITVNGEFKNRSIDDLEDADILLSIQYFRPQDKTLSVILENLPRQRYYVQVRAL